ncbi:(2Fe-2S)-binding protein [Paenibacillus sp. GCM10027628]|uniref:(2Fe-2S)-binding protein n=1 Tax=Paenibacillus sp. GCM10027628 TaxID=3273413 RepID=UPI003643F873
MDLTSVIICRCEEVSLAHLLETAKRYPCSSRELKLRTRAGMGYCGGRTCRLLVDTIVQELTDAPVSHDLSLKHQPPVRPVSFQCMGGDHP